MKSLLLRIRLLFCKKLIACDYASSTRADYSVEITYKMLNGVMYVIGQKVIEPQNDIEAANTSYNSHCMQCQGH